MQQLYDMEHKRISRTYVQAKSQFKRGNGASIRTCSYASLVDKAQSPLIPLDGMNTLSR